VSSRAITHDTIDDARRASPDDPRSMREEPWDIEPLVSLLRGRTIAVLTGAGVSTESGIPDYRGPTTRHRKRTPIQHHAFVHDPEARRRYWARSTLGWPRFRAARPNAGHAALAALEGVGALSGLVTQNVDQLHQAAGHRQVIELHGALADVICLSCGAHEDRDTLQHRLLVLNPHWIERAADVAPDGDAELPSEHVASFRMADCLECGGPLKPAVVFFGGNVARPVVDAAYAVIDRAEALLVVGSSLTVYSGLRFVRRAHERAIPVAILNVGETRGDPFATLRLDAPAGAALTALALTALR
jgi:NAD-dependent deacetylase sirtuin 4